MFTSRLLLPTTLALMPWLSACCWGQSYSPSQNGYRGSAPAARAVQTAMPQFSLPHQATRPPMFSDRQGNEYTAMSPNSWGHKVTQSRTYPNTMDGKSFSPTPVASVNQSTGPFESNPQLGSELRSVIAPLTNTGVRAARNDPPTSSDTASPFLQASSDGQQTSQFSNARYTRSQDVDSETQDLSSNGNGDVSFPFTRKKQSQLPASVDVLTGNTWLGAELAATPAVDAVDAVVPNQTQSAEGFRSSTILESQNEMFSTNAESEIGMYPQPRDASPMVQSYAPVTPSLSQPSPAFEQQGQVSNPIQPSFGFDYPAAEAIQTNVQPQPFVGAPLQSQQASQRQTVQWSDVNHANHVAQPAQPMLPDFRPDLGHRGVMPTVRNHPIRDDGKKFDHENKKVDYPPFKEIIATGKFFYNAEVNALRPSFLGNTGLSIDGAGFSESQPFDFDTTYAPQFKFGFESKYGPGVELSYFNLSANSNTLAATNDGTGSVASIASVTGPGRFSRIGADNVGDTLTANHSFEMETFGLNFFKELKFPISRLNGKFGFMYANVAQSLLVDVNNGGGTSVGGLNNTTDFRGYGPQFALEYFRPVGHTPLTLVTSFGGKGLFGRRDQFINNDAEGVVRRFGADEFITVIDFSGGVQLKKMVADGRYWTAKVGYVHQTWLGGGTAVDPQGDFGINGFAFGIGYNR